MPLDLVKQFIPLRAVRRLLDLIEQILLLLFKLVNRHLELLLDLLLLFLGLCQAMEGHECLKFITILSLTFTE